MKETKEFYKVLGQLNNEIVRIENEIKKIKSETEKLKNKNEKMKEQILILRAENNIMITERGWNGITDEEMKWVMDKKAFYFNLSLKTIREMIGNEKSVTNSD